MFKGLSVLTTKPVVTKTHKSKHAMMRAAQRHAQHVLHIANSCQKMRQITNEFSDLRHLNAVISVEGINRGLMLFVNPGDKILSKNIPTLPAIESLDSISLDSSDHRTVAAIEGISETINSEAKLISEWITAASVDVSQLLADVEDQFDDLGQSISDALTAFETGVTDAAVLATITANITSYDAAMSRLDALLDVLPDMDALVSDPTDGDAMASYQERLASIVEKLGPICGITVEETSPYLLLSDNVADEYLPSLGTLVELGYSIDNIVELLRRADNVVDELSGLIERKEAIIQQLNDAAANVAALDNDVPPATDDAIVSGDPTEDSVAGGPGVTQADLYHYQVSSHVYALAVITAVSLNAVGEVLAVADTILDI